MEHSSNSSLFSLTIDPTTKEHLSAVARWAKFLAIVGMVFLVLMIVFSLLFSTFFASNMINSDVESGPSELFSSFGVGLVIFYIIVAIIAFFPLLYLLRFANRTKRALNTNDQEALNNAFFNLKAYFRYLGIITIIVLALYAIALVFGLLGTAVFA